MNDYTYFGTINLAQAKYCLRKAEADFDNNGLVDTASFVKNKIMVRMQFPEGKYINRYIKNSYNDDILADRLFALNMHEIEVCEISRPDSRPHYIYIENHKVLSDFNDNNSDYKEGECPRNTVYKKIKLGNVLVVTDHGGDASDCCYTKYYFWDGKNFNGNLSMSYGE